MATPRRHPSRYDKWYADAFHRAASIPHATIARAARRRNSLYAFREALRSHPDYDPELLRIANASVIRQSGSTITITRKLEDPHDE